jgi:hypothetical protein
MHIVPIDPISILILALIELFIILLALGVLLIAYENKDNVD